MSKLKERLIVLRLTYILRVNYVHVTCCGDDYLRIINCTTQPYLKKHLKSLRKDRTAVFEVDFYVSSRNIYSVHAGDYNTWYMRCFFQLKTFLDQEINTRNLIFLLRYFYDEDKSLTLLPWVKKSVLASVRINSDTENLFDIQHASVATQSSKMRGTSLPWARPNPYLCQRPSPKAHRVSAYASCSSKSWHNNYKPLR